MSARAVTEAPEKDLLTYHMGLFLATNAIEDAYTIIDGPDCVFRKTQWVHGKHDWSSTLLNSLGEHRIANTLLTADRVILDRGDALRERLTQVASLKTAGAAFVCSMPHVTIIGTQYDRILRLLEPEVGVPLFEVPSRSLEGDWLEGYSDTLKVIAQGISIEGRGPRPGKVAVIGHLMDRVEQDQVANVRELRRLVEALGLEVTSVWLDGGRFRDLAAAADAELLLAFPLGYDAAAALAGRTGARVLRCDVPFGAGFTERMLRALGRATGRLEQAEALVERELSRLVPRLEWVVPHVFAHKSVAFWGPPFFFGGFLQVAAELGMETLLLGSSSNDRFVPPGLDDEFGPLPPVLLAPTRGAMERAMSGLSPDLLVGNSRFCSNFPPSVPSLEFSFPSHFSHALYPCPTLGFEGWMGFLDRMAGALTQAQRAASGRDATVLPR